MQTLDVHCVNSRAEDCFVDGAIIFNVLILVDSWSTSLNQYCMVNYFSQFCSLDAVNLLNNRVDLDL